MQKCSIEYRYRNVRLPDDQREFGASENDALCSPLPEFFNLIFRCSLATPNFRSRRPESSADARRACPSALSAPCLTSELFRRQELEFPAARTARAKSPEADALACTNR